MQMSYISDGGEFSGSVVLNILGIVVGPIHVIIARLLIQILVERDRERGRDRQTDRQTETETCKRDREILWTERRRETEGDRLIDRERLRIERQRKTEI